MAIIAGLYARCALWAGALGHVVARERAGEAMARSVPVAADVRAVRDDPHLAPWVAMAQERAGASPEPCFLVGDTASRRVISGASMRLWGAAVPAGALAMLEGSDGGLLCPTPAFHLMLRAADLDRVSLLRLAQEFWGTYDTRPDLPSGIAARPAPLCTRDALRDMAASVGERYPGKARVAWVLEHGVEGAASPPEGALGAFFSMGRRWGGVGVGPVLLNEPVELSERGRRVAGVGRLRPDILFPDGRLALEYDSEAHHGTAEARARDSERKLALEASGITVYSIGPSVLSSQRRLAALVDAVVERLTGRGEKPLGPRLAEARRRLLAGLLSREPLY